MRKTIVILLISLCILGCNSKTKEIAMKLEISTLKIGLTTNLTGKWFPATLKDSLENILHCKIEFFYFDGVADLLTCEDSLDLALGIDKSFLRQAIFSKKFCKYQSKELKNLKNLDFNKSNYFTPIFYDYVCILMDSTQIENTPLTLGKFQEDIYNNQLIFTHPLKFAHSRMFYVKTLSRFTQNGHRQFWKSIKNKIRAIVPNNAYALRMIKAKEAAFWIGGVSYCYYYPNLKPILLMGLSIKDIFGIGLYKNSPNKIVAQNFIDILLSNYVQNFLTENLSVYPVIKGVEKNSKLPTENFVDESKDAIKSGYIDWRSELYLDKHHDLFENL